MNRNTSDNTYEKVYKSLDSHYGSLNWWPADSPFEVMIGAILTQNTSWSNVEKAIGLLKKNRLLSLKAITNCSICELEENIRPSGFFRQKAERIKRLAALINTTFGGSIPKMAKSPLAALRRTLLDTNGIGPETADSILLYSLDKQVFVVDAYTRRIFSRLALLDGNEPYEAIRLKFESNVKPEFFNQYHALIVQLAKDLCKKKNPLCGSCPIGKFCHFSGANYH